MGWINQGQLRQPRVKSPNTLNREARERLSSKTKGAPFGHVEDVQFAFYPKKTQDEDLPHIPAEEVKQRDGKGDARLC